MKIANIFNRNPLRPNQRDMLIEGEKVKSLVSYYDPSSAKKGNDASIIAVCASTVEGNVFVLDAIALPEVSPTIGFDNQIRGVVATLEKHHCNSVWVETNFSMSLAAEIRKWCKERKKKISIKDTRRTSTQNKEIYISDAIEPLLKTGRLHIHDRVWKNSDFLTEMRTFPEGKHDDVIDAISGCIHELKIPGIQFTGKENDLTRTPLHRAPRVVVVN